MGKIPQYQRDKFASAYVGGSQVDRSGAIAVEGISNAVQAVANIEAEKIKQRNEVIVDQQANKALLEYSLAYQKQARDLQTEYADKPDQYATAVSEMGIKLQEEYMKNIPDERVRARFGGAANTTIRATQESALAWGAKKQEENAAIAAQETARLATLQIGQTTDIGTLVGNIYTARGEIANIPNMTPDKAKEIEQKYMPGMIESSVYSRIQSDPDGALADLKEGAYNDVPYFTDDMRRTLMSAAETRIRGIKTEITERQMVNSSEAMDLMTSGDLTFERINEYETAENPMDRMKDGDPARYRKALANKIIAEASDLAKDNAVAEKYIGIVNLMADNRIDRAKKLEQVLTAFSDGTLLAEEAKQLNDMIKPLQDAKRAVAVKKVIQSVNGILDWSKKLNPEDTGVFTGQVVREFFSQVREGKDAVDSAEQLKKQMLRDTLAEAGIDIEGLPPEGSRFFDEDGKSVWIFPDGTYKEGK